MAFRAHHKRVAARNEDDDGRSKAKSKRVAPNAWLRCRIQKPEKERLGTVLFQGLETAVGSTRGKFLGLIVRFMVW